MTTLTYVARRLRKAALTALLALHHSIGDAPVALRRLPDVGAHRENRPVPRLHDRRPLDVPPAAAIPLLPRPLPPRHAVLPPPHPAAVHIAVLRLAPAPRPAAALPERRVALDRAHRQLVHEAVPHPAHRVGVRPAVGGVGRELGRHREQRSCSRDIDGLWLRARPGARGHRRHDAREHGLAGPPLGWLGRPRLGRLAGGHVLREGLGHFEMDTKSRIEFIAEHCATMS
jgi:hypothetical protein